MYKNFLGISTIFVLMSLSGSLIAQQSNTEKYAKFSEFTENSKLEMDFSIVDQLLHAGVMNMGPSTRAWARKQPPSTGTRFTQTVDRATENEANRFFYENLKKDQEKILKLRKELETIPSLTPLNQYTKEAQLAYWLNLYKVTLINELAVIYPLNNLKPVLTGEKSILDKKTLSVDNVQLSLNDIHYRILPVLYPESTLYIYGLHQGIKGSPNIRNKAFTARDVKQKLKENAQEFVNSNRGTQFNGGEGVIRVSSFYKRNSQLFPDFNNSVKLHLLQFADTSSYELIKNATSVNANISNWRINDFYGSLRRRDIGLYVNSGDGNRFTTGNKLSPGQQTQLTLLMRVRAMNFGGGSVTVTDLDPAAESAPQTEESDTDNN
ncbi:MAG: hypothetical protein ACI97K_002365 [Glaciecola sp.]|jgi:hypothetical protein